MYVSNWFENIACTYVFFDTIMYSQDELIFTQDTPARYVSINSKNHISVNKLYIHRLLILPIFIVRLGLLAIGS